MVSFSRELLECENVYAFFLSTLITFLDENELVHIRTEFKTIYYNFYSDNKSLQSLGQYTSSPKNVFVALLFVISVSLEEKSVNMYQSLKR